MDFFEFLITQVVKILISREKKTSIEPKKC